jgi:hypothetical protein
VMGQHAWTLLKVFHLHGGWEVSRLKLTEVDSGAPISSLNFPPLIMSTLIAGQNIVKALKR